jgi:hypothetical protein
MFYNNFLAAHLSENEKMKVSCSTQDTRKSLGVFTGQNLQETYLFLRFFFL